MLDVVINQLFMTLIVVFLMSITCQAVRICAFTRHSERLTCWLSFTAIVTGSFIAVILAVLIFQHGPSLIFMGKWFSAKGYHYDFVWAVDSLAIIYALLVFLLSSVIVYFSKRYLHKDPGFHRFYFLLTLFVFGLLIASFSGSLALLVVGWEIVGLTSVLLISFFTYRQNPPRNALYTFVIYRLCDIGLIAAGLMIHHHVGSTVFALENNDSWYGVYTSSGIVLAGLALFLAASGKAALFPFSSWLPRAMEGPTPSSAIFYGALSVHLGPLLLLRSIHLIEQSRLLILVLFGIGAMTTICGMLVAQAQNDIKSRLAYGSVIQLGIIVCEISLGWTYLALIHIASHAILRTLQILRAPSLLHDYQHVTQMLGHSFAATNVYDKGAGVFSRILYRFSLERAFLDTLLRSYCIGNLSRLIAWLERIDDAIDYVISSRKNKISRRRGNS